MLDRGLQGSPLGVDSAARSSGEQEAGVAHTCHGTPRHESWQEDGATPRDRLAPIETKISEVAGSSGNHVGGGKRHLDHPTSGEGSSDGGSYHGDAKGAKIEQIQKQ